MNPQLIHTLVAIADSGSIRAAAEVLGKSQPALTKALRQAEDSLGVQLFQRSSRGVVLTEWGERVLVRARTIQTEMSRLGEEIAQLRGEQIGAVTVGLSPLAAVEIMPRAITLFRQKYPLIELRLMSSLFPSGLKPLREGRTDLMIGPSPPVGMRRDIAIEPLIDNPIIVITSTDSPFAGATSLGELIKAPWIMIGAPQGPGDIFRKPFLDHNFTPPRALTTSESYYGALALVESLGAVCTFPKRLLDSMQRNWNIVRIPVRETIDSLDMALMTRSGHPLTPAADALANAVRRRAAALR